MSQFSNADLAKCAAREAKMRARVYPRWVDGGKMKPDDAQREQAQMEAIAAHFGRLAEADAKAGELAL